MEVWRGWGRFGEVRRCLVLRGAVWLDAALRGAVLRGVVRRYVALHGTARCCAVLRGAVRCCGRFEALTVNNGVKMV